MVKSAGRRIRKYRRKLELPNPLQVYHTALKVYKADKIRRYEGKTPCLELLESIGVLTYLTHNLKVVDRAYIIRLVREFFSGKDIYGRCVKWLGREEICNELMRRLEEVINVCHYISCEYYRTGVTNAFISVRRVKLENMVILKEMCVYTERIKAFIKEIERRLVFKTPITKVRTIYTGVSVKRPISQLRTIYTTVGMKFPISKLRGITRTVELKPPLMYWRDLEHTVELVIE